MLPLVSNATLSIASRSTMSVSTFFSLERFDRRRGVAFYALRIINRTKSALICRTWVLSESGQPLLAYPALFEVQPFSTDSTEVPVWLRDFPGFDRAIAEVVGNGVHCIVEAAAPPRPSSRTQLLVAAGCFVAGMIALLAAAILHSAMPRIDALAAAPQALAGSTVEAQYHAFGAGKLMYQVTAPDGRRIAGGTLPEHAGSIFFPIAADAQPGPYVLRLAMNGWLGGANETRVIDAVLSPSGGAQIADISVHPIVARPGEPIDVAYSAAADGGYVRLVGTDGTIWAQQPYSRTGQTRLLLPPVTDAREMHVLLHVTKGKTAAQSVAGIVVAQRSSGSLPAASESPVLGDDANGAAVTTDDANGTFQVEGRTVKSGDPIQVKILSPRNGMHIALTDAQSHEVSGQDVGADAEIVTLRAPAVRLATRYTVVATFTDGFGQESIVQPITILP